MMNMNKPLVLLPLVLLAFTACGKKGGGAGAGGSAGDAAIEQVVNAVIDPVEEDLPEEEAPVDQAPEEEDRAEDTTDGLPVDQALESNRCFASRLNSNGFAVQSRIRIQLLGNGVGHIWVTTFQDAECNAEANRELLLFHYDVVRVDDGVHTLRLTGFGVSRRLGTLWLTVRRTQDGAVYDLDAAQEGSGPYAEAPGQEILARLLHDANGVRFAKEEAQE